MQGEPVNWPVTPDWVKLTVPVGVVGVAEESVTVALQVELSFTATGVVHETVVLVATNADGATADGEDRMASPRAGVADDTVGSTYGPGKMPTTSTDNRIIPYKMPAKRITRS